MQRPPDLAAGEGFIRFPCPLARMLGVQRDDGIQRGIVGCNLRQVSFQHFAGGHVSGADSGGYLCRAGENDIVHACSCLSLCAPSSNASTVPLWLRTPSGYPQAPVTASSSSSALSVAAAPLASPFN